MAARQLRGTDSRAADRSHRKRQRENDGGARLTDACSRTWIELLHDSIHEVAQRSLRRTRCCREARNRSAYDGRRVYLGHKKSGTGSANSARHMAAVRREVAKW